jgi:hypothetical protein
MGLTAGGTTAFYTYSIYMQKFLKLSVGLSDNQTTMVSAGSLIFAALPATDLRRAFGQDRAQAASDLVRSDGNRVYDSAASVPAIRKERRRRVRLDRGGVADRGRLYVDKCGGQSRAVPDQSSSHWSRSALCDRDVDIRRAGRVDRIVVQIDRPRSVVLLLPLVGDRDFAHRRDHDA